VLGLDRYGEVLRIPPVRRVLALALVTRIPLWAGNIVVTLHVVTHLHHSYAMAGLVSAVQGAMLGVSGPWRGRRLDQLGLRRAVLPSLVVVPACWSVAPFVGYWPFLLLVAAAALLTVPTFAITRQVIIGHTTLQQRTSALSVDGITTDLTFMVGPVVGVLLATTIPTPLALLICQLASVAGTGLIWVADPPLHAPGHAPAMTPEPGLPGHPGTGWRRFVPHWLTPRVVVVLAMAATATFVLIGEDLVAVAAMRHWHTPGATGWVLALWAAAAIPTGLVYGALRRHPPAAVVLVLLAISAVLVATAPDRTWFIVFLTLAGSLSSPTVTAVTDELSRVVPVGNRGEAMGWHGSATTLGNAVGAPVTGVAIDGFGWQGGLLAVGLVGLVISLAGLAIRRRASVATPARSRAGHG
jgi:predicted MFS family arabinose efflux permease